MKQDPKANPINSGRWVPPGYQSRKDLAAQTDAMERRKPLEKRVENANGFDGSQKPPPQAARASSDEATLA